MVNNEYAIQVDNISKDFKVYKDKAHTLKARLLSRKRNQYELNHVLKNVSFNIRKGEAYGLIGHNGCGKSTTLKLLNRILYPDSGSIKMNGKVSSLIELGAGFHPDMSGRENIYINASIFGLKRKEIDRRLDKIIHFSELEEFIDNPVRTYSSGMYMRLAFAIAINVDADILLVDEILAVGDANFQRKCFDKLCQIKEKGTSIVIVSHSMDQIKSVCDKVIWLDSGEIREQGSASTVCDDYLLAMSEAAAERSQFERETLGLDIPLDPTIQYPPAEVSEQCSKYCTRSGNMKTRFTNLEVLNERGEISTNFRYQEKFTIKFSVKEFEETGKRYNIVFVITGKDGNRCTMFESYLNNGEYLPASALRDAKFVVKDLKLAAGDYYLDAVVWDADVNQMDNLVRVIDFTVQTPKRNGIGLLAMDVNWEI